MQRSVQPQRSIWIRSVYLSLYQWLVTVFDGKKRKSTIASLDGVRAIACLIVVTFHISLITTQDVHLWSQKTMNPVVDALAFVGDTGVTLFFVLSGFLLFQPYAKALLSENTSWPSMRQFYLRRVLRIIPAYYLSLLLMVLLFAPDYLRLDHWKQWLPFLTLTMDSFKSTYRSINGPFWTLAVEWQFYLLLPWLALGIGVLVRRGSMLKRFWLVLSCLGGVMLWGIFSRGLGLYLTWHPNTTFLISRAKLNIILQVIYGPPIAGLHGKFLEDFAVGMTISLCYILLRQLPVQHKLSTIIQRISPWLLATSMLWLLGMALWKFYMSSHYQIPAFDAHTQVYSVLSEFGFAFGYGLLVAAALFGSALLKRPFEWTPLRWVGILSYGIYMWHLLLLEAFLDHVYRLLPQWPPYILYSTYWLWLLLFIIPCAFLLFLLIEKPFLELGSRLRANKTDISMSDEPQVTEKRKAVEVQRV